MIRICWTAKLPLGESCVCVCVYERDGGEWESECIFTEGPAMISSTCIIAMANHTHNNYTFHPVWYSKNAEHTYTPK